MSSPNSNPNSTAIDLRISYVKSAIDKYFHDLLSSPLDPPTTLNVFDRCIQILKQAKRQMETETESESEATTRVLSTRDTSNRSNNMLKRDRSSTMSSQIDPQNDDSGEDITTDSSNTSNANDMIMPLIISTIRTSVRSESLLFTLLSRIRTFSSALWLLSCMISRQHDIVHRIDITRNICPNTYWRKWSPRAQSLVIRTWNQR